MLFDNQTKHNLSLQAKDPTGAPVNLAFLIQHLCDKVMRDTRKELFVLNGSM